MADDNWERVQEIFLAAVGLPEGERSGFLVAACLDDHDLRAEVESLLDADTAPSLKLAEIIQAEACEVVGDSPRPDSRLGPYRLIRKIGRGGMGDVYLAERDDDQFHKRVAIKVVKRGMDTAEILSRFRHERQILANLDHPYIARLHDGGATEDGRPFFVMEYVEGQPISHFCRERELDTASRLRLFLHVAEAVSYAHRNLVVHRDLKPGNILVTGEGIPKLLDFGVAKLLDPERPAGMTLTLGAGGPMVTVEYASPEQVLGLPVTTTSDVYSLGAVLYEILTGTRARQFAARTAAEIERVICHTEPPRPSSVTRLDRDLDNIVLMAMRKEPARRYQSVDQFADDIRRHLDGRPVVARQDSWGYRLAKFVRRNRLSVGAAAAVLVSIVGGAVVAVEEARVAERQRAIAVVERDRAREQHARAEQERAAAVAERQRAEAQSQEAQRQRTRAESRLHDLLDLANQSLYRVEEDLSRQEGGTGARRQVVQATLAYLDRLAAAEGADRDISMAVVAGYLKMGDVLGRPRKPNLGNPVDALKSYRKAWALLDKVRRGRDSLDAALLWIDIGSRIALLEVEDVNNSSSAGTVARLLPEARRLTARYPDDREAGISLAKLYQELSDAEVTRNPPASVNYGRQAIAIFERLLARTPHDDNLLENVNSSYSQLANALSVAGDRAGALELAKKSLRGREERLTLHPADVVGRRDLVVSYTRVGDMLGGPFSQGGGGDGKAAYEYYKRAAEVAEGIAKADPDNRAAQDDYAIVLARLGGSLAPVGGAEEALRVLGQSAGMLEAALRLRPTVRIARITLCIADETMARQLEELSRFDEALARARAEWDVAKALVAEQPDYRPARHRLMAGYELQSRLLAKLGRREAAVAVAQEAARTVAAYPGEDFRRFYVARAWTCLGDVYAILSDWREARSAFEQARDAWKKIGPMAAPFDPQKEAASAEARLAEVEGHLAGEK